MDHHQTHSAVPRRQQRRARSAFSLIELLVVIALISVLLTLVLSGLNRATKTGRRVASQRSAAALVQAVDQFKKEFGFLPPLVHDGIALSANDSAFRPLLIDGINVADDGPLVEQTGGAYVYKTLVVWNDGLDYNFFRRRSGSGSDGINLPGSGSQWDDDDAWDDRRYSKYSLAYYLTGVLDRDVDGVRGPGMARPQIDGSFVGIGYPVGSVRDRYEPFMDVDRRGARLVSEYVDPQELEEHGSPGSAADYQSLLNMYDPATQQPNLYSIVDAFGNAFRYYRWEPGRFVNGQIVIENELDLNIPPVLIDPVEYQRVMNDPQNLEDDENKFLFDNTKLRNARFAVVSAGPDGLFGTERIETIADALGVAVPADQDGIALLRREAWADNAYEVGN